jgi:pyruvate/2-oxoglutarate dehydrogenase complex dihydrolipoamide acyltransferase (E2) component
VPDLPDASQPKAPLAAKPLLADLSEAKAPAAAVAAAASTAAPLPPSPTAVPPPPNTATIAVQAAVGRYQSAFSALNAGAALSVWPSVDAKALERAFERLETQALEFDRCVITVTGVLAEAVCAGRARYVPKVGNKSAHVESRQWKFHLRKTAEAWLIHSVNAR